MTQPRDPSKKQALHTERVRLLTNALAESLAPPEVLLQDLMDMVTMGFAGGDQALAQAALTAVVQRPDRHAWRAIALQGLTVRLPRAIAHAWSRGWEPADVVTYVRRRLGRSAAALASEAVTEELAGYAAVTLEPRWHAQVTEFEAKPWWPQDSTTVQAHLERDGWTVLAPQLLELIGFLQALPTLEMIAAMPGEYRPVLGEQPSKATSVDERVLSRIRALLAKAEATTSQAEAEAFTAGAQERMARHSIDLAMVQATPNHRGRQHGAGQQPVERRIWIDPPYERSKTALLDAVVGANRCRSVWTVNIGFCTIVGFEADLDATETLFTSLLVQATAAMTRAGQIEDDRGRARRKSFRASFLTAYAVRIGERLLEITQEQTRAANLELGEDRLLPVLAGRQDQVQEHFEELFPQVSRGRRLRIDDAMGWASGRGAADQANFTAGPSVDPR